MSNATDAIKKTIDVLSENGIKSLHILVNINYLEHHDDITEEFTEYIGEEEVGPVISLFDIQCSYLRFAQPSVFVLVLTNNPLESPVILDDRHLSEDELEELYDEQDQKYIM